MNFRITISRRVENLKCIRRFVNSALLHLQISEQDRHLLILAVDEVCTNRMVHEHAYCDKKMEVVVNIFRKELVVEIIDQGKCFNINNYEPPSLQVLVREKKQGGFGLALVKKIVDYIQWEQIENKSVCRLSKRLDTV